MLHYWKSLCHALEGLAYAVKTEKNLKIFVFGFLLAIVGALYFDFEPWEWMVILLAGGGFLGTELLNTSLERFTDAFDEHVRRRHDDSHYIAIKNTKDVASAAALTIGTAAVIIVVVLFWPHVAELLKA